MSCVSRSQNGLGNMIRGWPSRFVSLQEAWAVFFPHEVFRVQNPYLQDLQSTRHSRRKWARSICNIRVPVAVRFWDEKALSDPPKHQALANSGATIAEENASDSALQIASSWPSLSSSRCLQHSGTVFLKHRRQMFVWSETWQIRPRAGAPSKSESAFLSASACHAIHRYGSILLSFISNSTNRKNNSTIFSAHPFQQLTWKMLRIVDITLRRWLNTNVTTEPSPLWVVDLQVLNLYIWIYLNLPTSRNLGALGCLFHILSAS